MSRKEFFVKKSRPVAGIAGGVALMTTIVLNGHTSAAPSDQQAIQHIVRDSQVAEQKLCVLPPGFARVIQRLPPQAVRAITDHVASDLAQYYTGQLLGEQTTLLQRNCAAAVTGGQSVEIGGGVESMTFTKIDIQGVTASASGQETKWLEDLIQASTGVDIVRPRAVDNFQDKLVKTPSGWRITDEQLSMPLGQGL